VSGRELAAGKRGQRVLEKHQDEVAALVRFAIRGEIGLLYEGGNA